MAASRRVNLISQVWVEVTADDIAPFRMINTSKNGIQWIVDTVQPPATDASQDRAVELTVEESMSRFEEMTPGRLYLLGETGQHVVMVD